MRKRYIAIPLCVCLVFALFGCTSGAKATGNEETGMVSEMLAQSDITGPGTEAEKTEVKTETEALPTEPGYGFFAGYLRGAGRAERVTTAMHLYKVKPRNGSSVTCITMLHMGFPGKTNLLFCLIGGLLDWKRKSMMRMMQTGCGRCLRLWVSSMMRIINFL